jgi:dihydroorotase
MGTLLIRGGRIVDPTQGIDRVDDLLVRDGQVVACGQAGAQPVGRADETIDAAGLVVTPGLVDMHVHLREPGREEDETIETGTRAAVVGGFTSVACIPTPSRPSTRRPPWSSSTRRRPGPTTATCSWWPA